MSGERSAALFGTWRRVNELAGAEDTTTIRGLIAEAGIEPGVHVGVEPDDFTDEMVAEWCLGQWAEMIDAGSPFLNSARNISFSQYERIVGPLPVGAMGSSGGGWFASEVAEIIDRKQTGGQ